MPEFSLGASPRRGRGDAPRPTKAKKKPARRDMMVSCRAGLLFNGPTGVDGVPFNESADEFRSTYPRIRVSTRNRKTAATKSKGASGKSV
jgi:hypothetical protein